MVESGAWQQCHPWLEAFLPLHAVVELLPEILDRLPLELGDGHRAILVSRKGAPQFFAMPEGDASLLFAVLPTGVTQTQSHIFARLREIHRMLLEAGAKRYLSGWLGAMNDEDWARHYGDAYQRWSQLKKRYDPRGVFDSVLFSPAELSN
jgi:cytokinin dehydrogenase